MEKRRMHPCCRLLAGITLLAAFVSDLRAGDDAKELSKSLIFHAGFDGTVDARKGIDPKIRTAASLARTEVTDGIRTSHVELVAGAGRYGDALRFRAVADQVLLFSGRNAGYRKENWSGTVSFWLKLSPDEDLAPGYCDPIQLTDKTWNDSAMWVDFDKELPRAFRLGAFPRFTQWNPDNTPWEQFPVSDRPMIPVAKPPFSRDRWTQVVMTFDGVNSSSDSPATVVLYLDGQPRGSMTRPLQFDWDVDKSAIMLGISYIGDFDDLAVFSRALTADDVRRLYELPSGVGAL